MRKIILQEWISLDGYVADKNGQLDFFVAVDKESNKYSDQDQLKFMEDIDTILLGRITYDLFVQFWPTATSDMEVIADKLNSTNKIVFSNKLQKAPWGNWPEAEVIKGDASDELRKLKMKDGKDMVLWGSISLAQSLIQNNLVDEFHLQVCPTVIGGGRPLFRSNVNMDLIERKEYQSGTVFLRYKPKS